MQAPEPDSVPPPAVPSPNDGSGTDVGAHPTAEVGTTDPAKRAGSGPQQAFSPVLFGWLLVVYVALLAFLGRVVDGHSLGLPTTGHISVGLFMIGLRTWEPCIVNAQTRVRHGAWAWSPELSRSRAHAVSNIHRCDVRNVAPPCVAPYSMQTAGAVFA